VDTPFVRGRTLGLSRKYVNDIVDCKATRLTVGDIRQWTLEMNARNATSSFGQATAVSPWRQLFDLNRREHTLACRIHSKVAAHFSCK
jgi:hypothetical protein